MRLHTEVLRLSFMRCRYFFDPSPPPHRPNNTPGTSPPAGAGSVCWQGQGLSGSVGASSPAGAVRCKVRVTAIPHHLTQRGQHIGLSHEHTVGGRWAGGAAAITKNNGSIPLARPAVNGHLVPPRTIGVNEPNVGNIYEEGCCTWLMSE